MLPGCADDETGADTSVAETSAAGTKPDCVLAPELTEGPFYLDLDRVRRDITEGSEGAPLELSVTVVDAEACSPIRDAAVDVWHCDANGDYSGVTGTETTFLRGIQMTDDAGVAEFVTIYPGWYTGRAVHIHVKVHLGTERTYTGQLFFDDETTQRVYASEPYSDRPGPDTSNAADGIFGRSGGSTIVEVGEAGDGYRGTVTLGVPPA